jgi:hypothetical protein
MENRNGEEQDESTPLFSHYLLEKREREKNGNRVAVGVFRCVRYPHATRILSSILCLRYDLGDDTNDDEKKKNRLFLSFFFLLRTAYSQFNRNN